MQLSGAGKTLEERWQQGGVERHGEDKGGLGKTGLCFLYAEKF